MKVTVRGLAKTFRTMDGKVDAIHDLDFEVQPGQFYTLLGPSGCGKSTTLRCIAGLERPDAGEITIGDQTVSSANVFLPPNERPPPRRPFLSTPPKLEITFTSLHHQPPIAALPNAGK